MSVGFFQINREILDDPFFHSETASRGQAYMELVGLAKQKDEDFLVRGILVHGKQGCVYESQDSLARRWKWSRGKVIRFLRTLEKIGKIKTETTNKLTSIAICDFDRYVGD